MNPKVKYWIEDNKDKLVIGGAIVATVAMIAGGLYLSRRDNNYNVGDTVNVTLADYVAAQQTNGDIAFINLEDNDTPHVLDLTEEALMFRNENLDGFYVYDEGNVLDVNIVSDDEVTVSTLFTTEDIEDITSVVTANGKFAFKSDTKLIVTDASGVPVLAFDENPADVFQLAENGVYLSKGTEIHFVAYDSQDTQYIDIGDETTRFSQHGKTVIARNNFGSGENIETVLSITDGSLLIDNLRRLPSDNKVDIQVPMNENQLVYVQTRINSEDVITKQDLATLTLDEESTDEDIDLSDFTLPMDTLEPFSSDKSLAIRGYVYDWTDSGIRVIEMRNGREVTRLATDNSDVQIFVPIYVD